MKYKVVDNSHLVICGKFLKRWEYQTNLPASFEACMQVKKQQLEPDMGQQTASTLRKDYVKLVTLLISLMQSTSCEMPSWMTPRLKSRLKEEISTTSDMQMIPLQWEKVPLDESERADSFEKTLMLGKTEGKRRSG